MKSVTSVEKPLKICPAGSCGAATADPDIQIRPGDVVTFSTEQRTVPSAPFDDSKLRHFEEAVRTVAPFILCLHEQLSGLAAPSVYPEMTSRVKGSQEQEARTAGGAGSVCWC